jgi:SAM-dependent methyltransferase
VITGPDNPFALPEVEPLLREELVRVPALAARQPNGRALVLQACAANRELAADTRHLVAVRMHADERELRGDVVAAANALPWEDEAFHLVVVQHAGDVLAGPDVLVDELARVLAPGGTLLWFGLNPWSPWMAWLRWQARRGLLLPRAGSVDALRRHLLQGQLSPGRSETLGSFWPARDAETAATRGGAFGLLRGAWSLTASKQRAVLTPLRRRPLRERVAVQPPLAAPSRRVRA